MTDQTTAAPPGPGQAGSARKGPGPTPRDLAARAASREAADPHPGPAQHRKEPSGGPRCARRAAPPATRARATTRRHRADPAPRSEPAAAAGTRMTGASALVRTLERAPASGPGPRPPSSGCPRRRRAFCAAPGRRGAPRRGAGPVSPTGPFGGRTGAHHSYFLAGPGCRDPPLHRKRGPGGQVARGRAGALPRPAPHKGPGGPRSSGRSSQSLLGLQ